MKPHSLFLPGRLLLLGCALACAGCTIIPPAIPDTTRYYVLTTAPAKPATVAPAGPHWRIALRPVEVPAFLRGKAMQVRYTGNEIRYADEARWAESLEAGLGRVLRESLEGRGEVARVVSSPAEDHDFDVTVRVLHCEGDHENKLARFTAVVEVYPPGAGTERRARDTVTVEAAGWDGSYGQLALKLSEAVDGLADHITALVATADKK